LCDLLAWTKPLKSRYNKLSMPIHDGKTSAMENSYILVGEIPTALLLG
jgi:hypothetical protein